MYSIKVRNTTVVIEALNEVDKTLSKEVKSRIREIAKPTLSKARAFACGLGTSPTGSYAGSLHIKTHARGVKLASSDPGAGVIEFANPGALILEGERRGRRAGVPHGSTPPRALLKAVLEDEDYIVREVSDVVDELCDSVVRNCG